MRHGWEGDAWRWRGVRAAGMLPGYEGGGRVTGSESGAARAGTVSWSSARGNNGKKGMVLTSGAHEAVRGEVLHGRLV